MKEDGHIDPDLFDIFVREKVYLRYAREFLDPEQIDEVDETAHPRLQALRHGPAFRRDARPGRLP